MSAKHRGINKDRLKVSSDDHTSNSPLSSKVTLFTPEDGCGIAKVTQKRIFGGKVTKKGTFIVCVKYAPNRI